MLSSVAHTANIDINHASSDRLQQVKNNEKFENRHPKKLLRSLSRGGRLGQVATVKKNFRVFMWLNLF